MDHRMNFSQEEYTDAERKPAVSSHAVARSVSLPMIFCLDVNPFERVVVVP